MGIPELGGPDPFLLFLDPPSSFKCYPDSPFKIFIRNIFNLTWVQEF